MLTAPSTTNHPRVDELFLQWRHRQEGGQSATPEELCADCPNLMEELRGRIEAHLADPAPHSATTIKVTDTRRQQLAPAEMPRVPGYEVLGLLGRGGMGVVYQARQIGTDRLVAVKMMAAADAALPEECARFGREARALAQLSHPNIVQVYEVGEARFPDRELTVPFFSMEYVEGGPLSRHLDGKPLPARDAAALVQTLARAMHVAHQRGILHRDLKPSNVLLDCRLSIDDCRLVPSPSTEGNRGPIDDKQSTIDNPKIADFGLAKHLGQDLGQTPPGSVLGTPSYMAPEQAGLRKPPGPAADVYSLGAILYECLTGKPPFRAERPVDTLMQALSRPPEPPSSIAPGVPAALEAICLKCLEKQPGDRYSSALALADDLARFLRGEPVHGQPSWPERLGRWVWRDARRGLAVLLFCIVVVTGVVLWFSSPQRKLEAMKKELSQGRAVAAIPPGGKPVWFDWWEGEDRAALPREDDGHFRVGSRSTVLLGLVPEMPIDHYRVIADLDQAHPSEMGTAGVIVGHRAVQTPDGPAHYFFELVAVDRMPGGDRLQGWLRLRRYGGRGLNAHISTAMPLRGGASNVPRNAFPQPQPTRRLTVEVSSNFLRAWEDDTYLGEVKRQDLETMLKLCRKAGNLTYADAENDVLPPRGGVGLIVSGTTARFKSVRIEPVGGRANE